MGRFGNPDDLIAAAVFLAGDGARFVSGITLPVDGAYLCQGI
jgi:NAD(P)-dependent dehydrogenase (short-subunit alcohol dehydrogenase family)